MTELERCLDCGKVFEQWNPRLYVYYCKECNDKALYDEGLNRKEEKDVKNEINKKRKTVN
jgi:DNA-directed RNA polymerase subunit RPC12/RpoP